MRRVALVGFTLLITALAGCSGGGGGGGAVIQEPEAFKDTEVTESTGAIRGFVVTEAIVPIEGVLVQIIGGVNRTTDAEGAFVFNGLEPGDYFLIASKKGYSSIQQAATVVAGKEPDTTKFVLVANPSEAPFTTMQTWDGFLQCGFVVGNGFLGFQACGILDDRFIHYFALDQMPDYAQAEAVWDSTQAFGNDLSFSFYDGGTWHHKEVNGVSPLMINATREDIVDWWSENETELPMRMFPGNEAVSVTVNQQFTAYLTLFYNFLPRAGWTFAANGSCMVPADCS